jgi:FKBP-type peptidyl-prolyl cis-trans isomerase FklB
MRYPAIATAIILLLCNFSWAADSGQSLETQKEISFWSIGYQVGLSIMNDGVEIDFQKLIQGLQDAIDKKEPLLKVEEMRSLIVNLRQKAREIQTKKLQEAMVKNAEESEKFLDENGKKEGVKTTESGLQYRMLKEGDGPSPQPQDMVTVNYRGSFINGGEFDSSYARGEPQTVRTNGVIKGWSEALQMMKVGSKWEIFVPPHLAYGRNGLPGKIPPNKVLDFEIELLSIEKAEEGALN